MVYTIQQYLIRVFVVGMPLGTVTLRRFEEYLSLYNIRCKIKSCFNSNRKYPLSHYRELVHVNLDCTKRSLKATPIKANDTSIKL